MVWGFGPFGVSENKEVGAEDCCQSRRCHHRGCVGGGGGVVVVVVAGMGLGVGVGGGSGGGLAALVAGCGRRR